ncbi:hypothetical protein AMK59_878, partial [Oryctes borbonicus]
AAKRLNSSCSDLTIISLSADLEESSDKTVAHLVNKQRVLPFIPPSFPGSSDSNNLIKPSEYLRSISDKRASICSTKSSLDYEDTVTAVVEDKQDVISVASGPPPPPMPEFFKEIPQKVAGGKENENNKKHQPLSAISIQDLNSVQLRRTDKMVASKTFSAPTRSMSLQCLQSDNYLAQKSDLIAELKLSKDITGIKKMKIEKAKVDQKFEKEMYSEISKQFTVNNFVEKIPDKDLTGNMIPAWKRQMLAKKAAEKARKELEEQMHREAEEKRLLAIPQWKRQLIAKKEEAENKMRTIFHAIRPSEEKSKTTPHDVQECHRQNQQQEEKKQEMQDLNNNNNTSSINGDNCDSESSKDEEHIIPWRAQLRKTNSKLNLLD